VAFPLYDVPFSSTTNVYFLCSDQYRKQSSINHVPDLNQTKLCEQQTNKQTNNKPWSYAINKRCSRLVEVAYRDKIYIKANLVPLEAEFFRE